jgi:arylsulfatase A-like enzyme
VILRHTVSPNHYPTGWAQAFCAPFKWYKRFNWIGRVRDQYCHDIDLAPTTYEALGFEMPDRVKTIEQVPLEGTSVAYTFDDENAETQTRALEGRACRIRHGHAVHQRPAGRSAEDQGPDRHLHSPMRRSP